MGSGAQLENILRAVDCREVMKIGSFRLNVSHRKPSVSRSHKLY